MCVREHQNVLPFPTPHAWQMELHRWNVQLMFLFLVFWHRTFTFIEKASVYSPFRRSPVPSFPMFLPYAHGVIVRKPGKYTLSASTDLRRCHALFCSLRL